MIIKKSAKTLRKIIYSNLDQNQDKLDPEIFERRVSVILIYIGLIIALMVYGFTFGLIKEAILSTLAMIYIRQISGGNHFNSPDACFSVTLLVIILVSLTKFFIHDSYVLIVLVGCLIVYVLISPHQFEGSKEYWSYKFYLVVGLLIGCLYIKELMMMYLILTPDQIIKNKIYSVKNIKSE